MESPKKVIVIGAGFGGLALAIRLQAKGFQVTILEKRAKAGGRAYQLKAKGFTFDMGPSLVTEPAIIESVFKAAGKNMEDYLDLVMLDPFYRIYFHDKSYIDYCEDTDKMKKQMAVFNKEDANNYDRFMKLSKNFYDAVIKGGLGSSPISKIKDMLYMLPKVVQLKGFRSAYSLVSNYFKDFRHLFLFSFHPLFIGGNPFKSPALYLMIPYMEKKGGVLYTHGGMYSVIESFVKVFKELGGNILTNAEVQRLEIKDGKATGAYANDKFIAADLVVSNADFRNTYSDLIDQKHRSKWTDKKLSKLDYSMSAFVMYLGLNKKYEQLLHHSIILSERYKELIDDIFINKTVPDDFSLYMHCPSKTDPSMAPEGKESLYILAPVANLDSTFDWDKEKDVYKEKILSFLEHNFGLQGLKESIEFLEIMTPKDFEATQNAHLGSAWGVQPKLLQSAYFRPHNQSEDIENMFIVGASTHPGAGVPGVLLTAEATEKAINNYTQPFKPSKSA